EAGLAVTGRAAHADAERHARTARAIRKEGFGDRRRALQKRQQLVAQQVARLTAREVKAAVRAADVSSQLRALEAPQAAYAGLKEAREGGEARWLGAVRLEREAAGEILLEGDVHTVAERARQMI